MGLSIHYNGCLAKAELLPALIEEVEEIARTMDWEYEIFERYYPKAGFKKFNGQKSVYGLSFTPPQCETVFISFLADGRISSPLHLHFWGDSVNPQERDYLYLISVKTHYAGMDVHRQIIELIHYLEKKYFAEFSLYDESHYWETGDVAVMRSNFDRYHHLMDQFSNDLVHLPQRKGESDEEYILRLMKRMELRNEKGDESDS